MFLNIHNAIKNTPVETTFFKGILMVPILGHVIQIWKRFILCNELKAVESQYANLQGQQYLRVVQFIKSKARPIHNLNRQALLYGIVGDVAGTIIACKFFPAVNPPGFVMLSFLFRFTILTIDELKELEVERKHVAALG